MTTNGQNNDSNWDWKDAFETAGGIGSVIKLLSLLKGSGGGVQLPTPFEGPAVGLPMRTAQAVEEVLPTASQAFQGLASVEEVAPLASQAFFRSCS